MEHDAVNEHGTEHDAYSGINPEDLYDFAIIGGGPVGQYAAYYAGLRGMRVKIIDSLQEVGGQLAALYPEKYIFDVAGYPKVYARDLVNSLNDQMMQYNPTVCLGEKVMNLTANGVVTMETDKGVMHYAKSALIAIGRGAFKPRKIDFDNLEKLEEQGIHYFVKDKSIFKGKRLMIVGGGDSAFDWALNLSEIAQSITLIHRSDQFRAHEDTVVKVLELPVTIKTFYELKAVHGDDTLTGVTIFHNKPDKTEETHEIDALLINVGFLTDLGPVKDWGLEMGGKNRLLVNSKMQTNLPGVFAAGDITDYEGKLDLISTGFGEAAIAANYAKALVDPKAKASPGHSSDLVPKKKAHDAAAA